MKNRLIKMPCDNGFTLLEVVICLGLISIALLAVFHLQASNLNLQSEAKFITTASQLMQDRLSHIRSLITTVQGPFSGDFGPQFPDFQYSGEITGTSMDGLYKVTMNVDNGEGKTMNRLSCETYIYRPGE